MLCNAHYAILEQTQKASFDVTDWLAWFLAAGQWAAIAKCSPDTALRDINELIERGVLRKALGGGRSSAYELEEG